MLNSYQTRQYKVDGEKYIDIGITSILELPKEMLANEPTFDLDKYLRLKAILTEQLENVAIATNKIRVTNSDVNAETFNEDEKQLFNHITEFYKKREPEIGINAYSRSMAVMRFILEGKYKTRIDLMREKLDALVKEKKLSQDIADAQLSNYKMQFIIKSAISGKARVTDVDA